MAIIRPMWRRTCEKLGRGRLIECTVTVIQKWRDLCSGTEGEVFGHAAAGLWAAEDGGMNGVSQGFLLKFEVLTLTPTYLASWI
jgi:hypothetical protein